MKRVFVAGLALVVLAGCGGGRKVVPVSGVVTLNGQPYKNAIVTFQPVGNESDPNPGRGSAGITDENGRFTLTYDGEKPGALIGKHRIRIVTKHVANDEPVDDRSESRPGVMPVRNFEPIPLEWNELSERTFEVPSGGTDQANFAIENPRLPKK
jgi:hypothetical protein